MGNKSQSTSVGVILGLAVMMITVLGFGPYVFDPNLRGAPIGSPGLSNPYVRGTLNDRLVFTYYFYWYDWDSGMHFNGMGCADHNRYHPFDQESVSYLDPNWHYREFKDMMKAGIDVFMPVFWGGNPGNGLNDTWSKQGLYVMEQALDRFDLENAGAVNPLGVTNPIPKAAMFYDTTAMCLEYHGDPDPNRPGELNCTGDLTNPDHCDTFYAMIADFFSAFDEDHIQQVPNADDPTAPTAYIVWFYGDNWFARTDQSCIDHCKTRFLEEFNHTLVFVGTGGWRDGCPDLEGYYLWGSAVYGMKNYDYSPIRIASLGPGFDNGNASLGAVCQVNQTPLFVPRSPESYASNWTAAIATDPNWIVVETWNEFHEGTVICRTTEFGDEYINLTAEYSRQFHVLPQQLIRWEKLVRNHWGIIPGIICVVLVAIVIKKGRE
jgi:hypothetical protein